MRELGNYLILVGHYGGTMLAADWIIDIGPGAGAHGGQVVAEGTPAQLKKNKKSITGLYLSGQKYIELPETRRKPDFKKLLSIYGAGENNLKDVDVSIPLG